MMLSPLLSTPLHSSLFYTMMTSPNGGLFRVNGHLCGEFIGHSPVTGEFPTRRALMFSFHLRLNKRLSRQSWGWWFEMPSCHYDVTVIWHSLPRPSWSFLKILMSHLIETLPRGWQGSVNSVCSIQRLLMIWRWKKWEYSQPWYWPSYPGIFWFLQKLSLPEARWRISASEPGHQWYRLWFVVCSAPKHYYPNHWWLIVNWTSRKKLPWEHEKKNKHKSFLHQNTFENILCKISVILLRSQCVNRCYIHTYKSHALFYAEHDAADIFITTAWWFLIYAIANRSACWETQVAECRNCLLLDSFTVCLHSPCLSLELCRGGRVSPVTCAYSPLQLRQI